MRNFNIRKKLLIGFFSMLFILGVLGSFGIKAVRNLHGTFTQFFDVYSPTLEALQGIKIRASEIEALTVGFELISFGSTVEEDTPGGNRKSELLSNIETMERQIKKFQELSSQRGPSDHNFISSIIQKKDQLVLTALEYLRMKETSKSEKWLAAQKLNLETARQDLKRIIEKALDYETELLLDRKAQASQSARETYALSLIFAFLSIIISLVFSYFFATVISKPLHHLRDVAHEISNGDLKKRVKVVGSDEIADLGTSFNKMTESLVRSTQYLSGVIQTMPMVLFVTDSNLKLLKLNNTAKDLLGYEEKDLIGKSIDMIHPNREIFQNKKQFSNQLDPTKNLESTLVSKSGEKVAVSLSITSMWNESGLFDGFLCVAHDIREQKRTQEVLMRTEKLSAVGQLAAGMAHEINNPLGIILGFSQTALEEYKSVEGLRVPLQFIEREALRCKELVNKLLVYSKKAREDQVEILDIHSTIEEFLPFLSAQCSAKNVRLISRLDKNLPKMRANRTQLRQVISNLCKNAVDAMGEKAVLTIETSVTQKNGDEWITLRVSDTGQGIPEKIRSKIFDPFFTTKEVGKGTGLGLSLINEIVQKHKGTIEIDSEKGKGTTFTVYFPIQRHRIRKVA